MSITLAGNGGGGGVELTSDDIFLPLLESTDFGMNRIFSVALVYCDKMSTIASLGAKGEIKNILDSGGFFKSIQQYLQRKFPHKTYQNFKKKCS